MAVFKARYKGTCNKCQGAVSPGEYVSWSRRSRGVIYHARCIGEEIPPGETPGQPEPQPSGEGGQEQPQPQPEQPRVSVSDEYIRAIAQEEDAGQLGKLMTAVDERLRRERTTTLKITVTDDKGNEVELERVDNAHHMLERLVYLIRAGRHAYLAGPPGSGKSTGAVQAAQVLKRRYGYTSLNPQTPESRLLGFIDAGGTYRETEYFRCYTQGGVFCIDELDNGHPALLNTLNGMLETDHDGIGRGAFPCGVVERHRDFVCVATGNTNGRGGDKLFPERRALDAAFMERFAFLAWGYDEALEQALTLSANNEHGASWLAWVRAVRSYVASQGIRLHATPRASVNGAKLLKDSGWPVRDIADAVLFKGLDNDTTARIVEACPLPVLA